MRGDLWSFIHALPALRLGRGPWYLTKGIIASGDSKLSRLDSLGLKPDIVQSIRGKIMQKSITFLKFWDNTIEGYIKRIGSRTYVKFQNLTLKMKVNFLFLGQPFFWGKIWLKQFCFLLYDSPYGNKHTNAYFFSKTSNCSSVTMHFKLVAQLSRSPRSFFKRILALACLVSN